LNNFAKFSLSSVGACRERGLEYGKIWQTQMLILPITRHLAFGYDGRIAQSNEN
jgi:hypothetical protein